MYTWPHGHHHLRPNHAAHSMHPHHFKCAPTALLQMHPHRFARAPIMCNPIDLNTPPLLQTRSRCFLHIPVALNMPQSHCMPPHR
ncbi:hypothetical protein OG21DRAFT_1518428, partial [Imleria badia]